MRKGVSRRLQELEEKQLNTKNHDRIIYWTSWISVVVSVIVLAAKFFAYKITGSNAVYSDAMESIVNVTAAILSTFLIRGAVKPADQDHPYGHGKLEYFSASFEGGLITLASLLIIYQASEALYLGHELRKLDVGFLVVLSTAVANSLLGAYLLWRGKRHHSQALSASGHHVLSDVWTTLGAGLALILVHLTGKNWIDPLVSIGLALFLANTGVKIVRGSLSGLLDEEDPSLLKKLAAIFEKYREPWVIQIHHTRIIRSGRFHHIDSHMVIPEFLDIKESHELMNEFEAKVLRDYSLDGEIVFHTDPCRRAYCRACSMPECPIRKAPFSERIPVMLEHMQSKIEPVEFYE